MIRPPLYPQISPKGISLSARLRPLSDREGIRGGPLDRGQDYTQQRQISLETRCPRRAPEVNQRRSATMTMELTFVATTTRSNMWRKTSLSRNRCSRFSDPQKALNYQRALAAFTRIVDEPASVPGLLQNAAAQVARITHIKHVKTPALSPRSGRSPSRGRRRLEARRGRTCQLWRRPVFRAWLLDANRR